MAHPLTTDGGARYFDTAFVANDTLIADVLILATIALPIFRWPEDRLAKQPVFFGPQTTIVDSFRLGDFPVRPGLDLIGRSQTDTQRAKIFRFQCVPPVCVLVLNVKWSLC